VKKAMMKTALMMLVAIALGACGGAQRGGASSETRFGLAEIKITEKTQGVMIHADGKVEAVSDDQKMVLGTLTTDGTFTDTTGATGKMNAQGQFVTKNGPSPFTLKGETLTFEDKVITINGDNHLQGPGTDGVKLEGVSDVPTRRTALLLIGMIMSIK
jgi:hypothetical protein